MYSGLCTQLVLYNFWLMVPIMLLKILSSTVLITK